MSAALYPISQMFNRHPVSFRLLCFYSVRSASVRVDWKPREASQSRRANRITWTVPVPTAMGLDPKALPEPPSERERGEDQRSRHVRQGFRRVAVANFNGVPQVRGVVRRVQSVGGVLLFLGLSARIVVRGRSRVVSNTRG